MTTLKFRDHFLRYPEYSDAIAVITKKLGGTCSFGIEMNKYETLHWQAENPYPAPSEEEIKEVLETLITEYNADRYKIDRYTEYASVEEQLAILWDDMDTGSIPGKETSMWYAAIKEIKDKYPKP
jgi:hypothetical protein